MQAVHTVKNNSQKQHWSRAYWYHLNQWFKNDWNLFVLTSGTGNLDAECNLEVTTSSRCCGRRWCRLEYWSKIDV